MIKINSDKIDEQELLNSIDNILNSSNHTQYNIKPNNKLDEVIAILEKENYFKSLKRKIINKLKGLNVLYFFKKKSSFYNNKKSKTYTLDDFLKYQNEDFIKNLFNTILNREPTQNEIAKYTTLLRRGKITKIDTIIKIKYSKEAKNFSKINIKGLRKWYFRYILYNIPIVGYIIKSIIFLITIPKQKEYIISQANNIPYIREELISQINSQFNKMNENYQNKIQKLQKDILTLKREKIELQKTIQSLQFGKINANTQNNTVNPPTLNSNYDSFYISFEDIFRGKREEIKNRQKVYLPIIQEVITETDDTVLDIGCGRGEWLELLKEHNIQAKGIDLNAIMVEETKSLGLEATKDDAISYLQKLPSNSIKVITAFHIVEHLPFEALMNFIDESYRVLKEGGIIIYETPNPENLIVSTYTFYLDPTHKNPIPPELLSFMVEHRGFTQVSIKRLHPFNEQNIQNPQNQDEINTIIDRINKEQDYSVIGYKL